MLHVLTDAHQFSCQPKLLLDFFVGLDLRIRVVGAIEVPCVEAGEVLNRSEELVAADYVAVVSLAISIGSLSERRRAYW